MTQLDVALLVGALRFAEPVTGRLLTSECADPSSMLTTLLGAPPTPAQQAALATVSAAVQTQLTAAVTAQAALDASMTPVPGTLAAVGAAATALATVLRTIAQAATAMGAGGAVTGLPAVDAGMQQLLRAALAGLGSTFGGLPAQLGLAAGGTTVAGSVTVAGTLIMCTLGNVADRDVGGAGIFTLHDSRFDGLLDWGPAVPLPLKLRLLTGLRVGVAPDGLVRQVLGGLGSVDTTVTVNDDPQAGITFGQGVKHRLAIPGKISVGTVRLTDLNLVLPDPGELSGPNPSARLRDHGHHQRHPGDHQGRRRGSRRRVRHRSRRGRRGHREPRDARPDPADGCRPAGRRRARARGRLRQPPRHRVRRRPRSRARADRDQAVGLIGTEPFSLVLVLSIEFTPAIQLSFGFTLNGVGGLLALERTVNGDALSAGLRTHAIDSLLFPADPVAAAPKLLTMLDADFPPSPGGFVVGPMVELGWGTPISFVTAKIGVIIALPDPKVIILGALRVALPAPDAPLVDLRAELYGEITPQHLLVIVSLAGSKVAGFALTGDFGLLIGYGDDPEFVLSAGGFHPHYTPPAELAGLARVSVDLSPPSLITLQTRAYLALTSNSFQLGAQLQLRADVAGVGAEGHLGFDAIVRWSPRFSFEIDLSAGVSLYAFGTSFAGIDLALHLEGPGPWLAHGTASISLLFFDVDFSVGPISWGEGDNPVPASTSPVEIVGVALDRPASWRPVAPDGSDRVATLTATAAGSADTPADAILVHPLGAFEVRQHAVPLETVIDRIGPDSVTEPRVNLGAPTVAGFDVSAVSATTDRFAPGEFLTLTDDQKLSVPAFEDFPSGMRFAGVAQDPHGPPVQSLYEWNTVYPHDDTLTQIYETVLFDRFLLAGIVAGGPAANAAVRAAASYLTTPPDPVVLADPGQVRVRGVANLGAVAGVAATAVTTTMTTTAANRLVADLTAATPALVGALELVGAGVGA